MRFSVTGTTYFGEQSVAAASALPVGQWTHVAVTGTASTSLLYLYLQSAGDIYMDDIVMVAGSVAESGPNLLKDGGFESGFPGSVWTVSPNLSASALSVKVPRSPRFLPRSVSWMLLPSTTMPSPESAVHWIEKGFRAISLGSDISVFLDGVRRFRAQVAQSSRALSNESKVGKA